MIILLEKALSALSFLNKLFGLVLADDRDKSLEHDTITQLKQYLTQIIS